MFSIVSMQDILINLDGSDQLFQRFDRARSRKKSTTIKSSKEKTHAVTIQRIWVLPSHVIVLSNDGALELIVYDQVPKIGPYTTGPFNLLTDLEGDDSGILDVIYDYQWRRQYVVLVFKSGVFVAYSFVKPAYEWVRLSRGSLCKAKNTLVSAISYKTDAKVLVWSEKRSLAHFSICTGLFEFGENSFDVVDIRSLLHNCLPMHFYSASSGDMCFYPSAPAGLMLFWSIKTDEITLRMWGDEFNTLSTPTTSCDFQSLVTSSMFLWSHTSNTSINDVKIIALASHPTTMELLVLQSDLQLFVIKRNEAGKIWMYYLCTLEVEKEKESYAKNITALNPVQRLVLVTKMDGVIDIFDVRRGLFLWKTTTFKANSPNIWLRLGPHPTFGVWNKSGIWNLRAKPIAEQIQEFKNRKYPEQNEDEATIRQIDDVEHALDVFDEHKKQQQQQPLKNSQRRRIKQGVNRSSALPLQYLLQILNQWNLPNVSTEMALNVMLSLKESMKESSDVDGQIDTDEMKCILKQINDPIILLALFADKSLPYSLQKKLVIKLDKILQDSSAKYIDKKFMDILLEYIQVEKELKTSASIPQSIPQCSGNDVIVERELLCLQRQCTLGNLAEIDLRFTHLIEIDFDSFWKRTVSYILPDENNRSCDAEDKTQNHFYDVFWKVLLRPNSLALPQLVLLLWQQSPSLLLKFSYQAEKRIIEPKNFQDKDCIKLETFINTIISLITLPTERDNEFDPENERVEVYGSLLQMSTNHSTDDVFQLYINYKMYTKAFTILNRCNDNSQLHYSMFYKLFVALIKDKLIGDYCEPLQLVIPKQFNLVENYVVLNNTLAEMESSSEVFVKSSNTLTIGMFRPLLESMLKST